MIPPDLAARIRMMVEAELLRPEAQVGGVERIRPLPERLPEVLPGQVLRATIQRPLPEGTYQAVVAGREMTLALDQPVKSGVPASPRSTASAHRPWATCSARCRLIALNHCSRSGRYSWGSR